MVQKQDFIYGDTINGKFWNIELLDTNEIITYYGKIGNKPRLSKQSFDNYQEALSFYHTIIQKKISKGYSPIKKDIPITPPVISITPPNISINPKDCRENKERCPELSLEKNKDLVCNESTGRCITASKTKKNTANHQPVIHHNNNINAKDCRENKERCPELSLEKNKDLVCNESTGRCITASKTKKNTANHQPVIHHNNNINAKDCRENKERCPELSLEKNKDLVCNESTGRCITASKTKKNTTTTMVNKPKEPELPKPEINTVVFKGEPMLADKFYDSNIDMEYKETKKKPKKAHYIYHGTSGKRVQNKWVFENIPTVYHINPTNWLLSEKYDGVRAVWNGKDFVSRTNKIYHAPEWFKKLMPPSRALDGELHCGRGNFQLVSGITRHLVPNDKDWATVTYQVFDIPEKNFSTIPLYKRLVQLHNLVLESCQKWDSIHLPDTIDKPHHCPLQFTQQYTIKNMEHAYQLYKEAIINGAEGVMIRHPDSNYEYKRSKNLLKWKPILDAEGVVIDYNEGTGRLKGMLGTFKVMLINDNTKKIDKDKIFNLSGRLTDDFRSKYKFKNGSIITTPPNNNNIYPVINDIVTFTFMEYTNDGIPRQPIYQRIRNEN